MENYRLSQKRENGRLRTNQRNVVVSLQHSNYCLVCVAYDRVHLLSELQIVSNQRLFPKAPALLDNQLYTAVFVTAAGLAADEDEELGGQIALLDDCLALHHNPDPQTPTHFEPEVGLVSSWKFGKVGKLL